MGYDIGAKATINVDVYDVPNSREYEIEISLQEHFKSLCLLTWFTWFTWITWLPWWQVDHPTGSDEGGKRRICLSHTVHV